MGTNGIKSSIIFVHYGMNEIRRSLALQSLQSLYDSVKHLPCEIIVVDNGGDMRESRAFLEWVNSKKVTHYIRNADNIWFGKGRNQAMRICEGEFIAVVDNDLLYQIGWLEHCIEALENAKEKKLMVTPIRVIQGHRKHNRKEVINGKEYLINTLAGSNCWVMSRKQMNEIGEFEDHHFSGTLWCRKYVRMGYALIVIDEKLVTDEGDKHTVKFGYVRYGKQEQKRQVIIKKELTNGQEVIYFTGELW